MARSKPYTKTLLVIDLILTLITSGGWLIIVALRELYRYGAVSASSKRSC